MYYNQYPDEAGNSPLEAEDTKLKKQLSLTFPFINKTIEFVKVGA